MDIVGPSFDGFVTGGACKNGQEVWFRMRCNGNEELDFIADFQKIDQAIAALASFAATALAERSASSDSKFEKSAVMQITSFQSLESFDPSKVALRVMTDIGAELSFDMSKDAALSLSNELRHAATKETPDYPPRNS